MSSPERIAELMFRYTCGELSAKEKAELLAWRNLSPENESVFQDETDPGRLASSIKRMQDNKEIIFHKIMSREYAPLPRTEIRRFRIEKFMRAAAIFVVSLGALIYLLSIDISGDHDGGPDPEGEATFLSSDGVATAIDDFHRGWLAGHAGISFHKDKNGKRVYVAKDRPHAKDKYYELKAAIRGRICLMLPDSSFVWLNNGSSIKYPTHFFTDTSALIIEGEAYIEPAKSRQTPLHVSLRGMELTAGASRFNARAYPDDSVGTATLLEGNLRVRRDSKPGASSPEVLLQPGEQARVAGDSLHIVQHVDVDQVIAWKTRGRGRSK